MSPPFFKCKSFLDFRVPSWCHFSDVRNVSAGGLGTIRSASILIVDGTIRRNSGFLESSFRMTSCRHIQHVITMPPASHAIAAKVCSVLTEIVALRFGPCNVAYVRTAQIVRLGSTDSIPLLQQFLAATTTRPTKDNNLQYMHPTFDTLIGIICVCSC
jgi:hypothetical protein